MEKFKLLTGSMRVPFLALPPACVLLGIGVAVHEGAPITWFQVVLILIWAVLGHISVNALNEYDDFKTGLDSRTVRTPFSGGSGTLQAHPELAGWVQTMAIIAIVIDAIISLYFAFLRGWGIIPLGLLGLLVIYAYSVRFVYNPILCLIVPGIGFGTVMVMGTNYMLTGHYSWVAFAASMIPFFLVSNLLLLNQFPDVEADLTVGRRHLPIVAGRKNSSLVYSFFLIATYLTIILGVVFGLFPLTTLIGLFTLPLAVMASLGAYRYANDIPKLIPSMGMNVILNLVTPTLVAVGFFIAPVLH